MLSIAALGATNYHVRLAQEEYYDPQRAGERLGFFLGRGAELLGLQGTVSKDQFKSLMRGIHPETNVPLRKTSGKRTADAARDLTLSAPKSWSVILGATKDPRIREKTEGAFDRSIRWAAGRIEEASFTRVGKSSRLVPAKPVISCFIHTSSRALDHDPQWHAHLVVKNVGVREDGLTGAILSRPYYVRKMAWGALFRCDMAYELQQAFPGIEFRRTKTGVEIAGVPHSLLHHFSKRRREIEAEVGDPDKATAIDKAKACLKTRRSKQLPPPLAELRTRWRQEARQFGFGQREITHLLRRRPARHVDKSEVLQQAFDTAITRLTQRQSHFDELEMVRYAADWATGRGVQGQEVVDHVARELRRSPTIVYLGELRGRPRYSTKEVLKQEGKLLETAEKMAARPSHRVTFARLVLRASLETAPAIRRWLTLQSDRTLTADQRKAIKFVAQRSGRLAVLAAGAGTAKLETLSRLGQFYRATGNSVLAVAPNARAARRLNEEADLSATTLATLLHLADRDRSPVAAAKHAAKQLVREAAGRYIGLFPFKRRPLLTPNTVLLVDAAQRISSQDMAKLLAHAKRAGSKLVLAGNTDGLQAVERGVPFASLVRRLPCARLTETVRPRNREDVQNIERVTAGEAKAALEDLARRRRLHVAASRESAIERLLAEWKRSGGIDNAKDHLIIVSSQQEARQVNNRASEIRRAGQKGHRRITKDESIILASGEKIHVGDRILCTRNSRRYGVQRGSLGTLLGVSRRLNSIQIELDGGDRVTLPLVAYPHVTRGYAQTMWHAGPAPHAYLLLGGGYEDRQAAVVKFSRAAETTRVYVDRDSAGPELAELSRQLSHDRTKTLATDVQRPAHSPQQERS